MLRRLPNINNAGGFFSIGGSLISNDGSDVLFFFSNSTSNGIGPVELEITTGSVSPPAIPEPSTILSFGSGLAELAAWRYKTRR